MADVSDMYEETGRATIHITLLCWTPQRSQVVTNPAVLHSVLDATGTVHPEAWEPPAVELGDAKGHLVIVSFIG